MVGKPLVFSYFDITNHGKGKKKQQKQQQMRRPPAISFSGRNLNGGESESDSDLSAASDLELRLRLRSHTSSRLATLRTASDLSASRRSVGIRCPLIARSYLRHCDNGDIVINGRDIVQRRPAQWPLRA